MSPLTKDGILLQDKSTYTLGINVPANCNKGPLFVWYQLGFYYFAYFDLTLATGTRVMFVTSQFPQRNVTTGISWCAGEKKKGMWKRSSKGVVRGPFSLPSQALDTKLWVPSWVRSGAAQVNWILAFSSVKLTLHSYCEESRLSVKRLAQLGNDSQ